MHQNDDRDVQQRTPCPLALSAPKYGDRDDAGCGDGKTTGDPSATGRPAEGPWNSLQVALRIG